MRICGLFSLAFGPVAPWKDQLNDTLGSYTAGSARRLVDSCGEDKSLDCWCQLADSGDSMKPTT